MRSAFYIPICFLIACGSGVTQEFGDSISDDATRSSEAFKLAGPSKCTEVASATSSMTMTVGGSGSGQCGPAQPASIPAPDAPSLQSLVKTPDGKINVTYKDNAANELEFRVYRKIQGLPDQRADLTSNFILVATRAYLVNSGSSVTTPDALSLQSGKSYEYKVAACNKNESGVDQCTYSALSSVFFGDCSTPVSMTFGEVTRLTNSHVDRYSSRFPYATSPKVASKPDSGGDWKKGEFAIAWRDLRLSSDEIFTARVETRGSLLRSATQATSTSDLAGCTGAPAIEYSSSLGKYILSWTNGRTATCWSNHDISASLIESDGSPSNSGRRVDLASPAGTTDGVRVTMGPTGISVITSAFPSFNGGLFMERLLPDSSPAGLSWINPRNFMIADSSAYRWKSSIAWNSTANQYGLVYKQGSSQYGPGKIFFGRRDSVGAQVGTDLELESLSGDLPQIAAANGEGWGVAWIANDEVHFQSFDPFGVRRGTEARFSIGRPANSAEIAWTGREYAIQWMVQGTADFGFGDAYLAVRTPTGNEVLGATPLSSISGFNLHYGPRIHGGKFDLTSIAAIPVTTTTNMPSPVGLSFTADGDRYPCNEGDQLLCSDIYFVPVMIDAHCPRS